MREPIEWGNLLSEEILSEEILSEEILSEVAY